MTSRQHDRVVESSANPAGQKASPASGKRTSSLMGAFSMLMGNSASRVLTLVQVLVITRLMGDVYYGQWSTVQAFPAILLVLTDLGLNSVMVRELAANPSIEPRAIAACLLAKVGLVTTFFIASIVAAMSQAKYMAIVPTVAWYSFGCIMGSFTEVITARNRSQNNFKAESIAFPIRDACFFLSVCFVVWIHGPVHDLAIAFAIVNTCLAVFMVSRYLKSFPLQFDSNTPALAWSFLRRGGPFAVWSLADPLFLQVGLLLLTVYWDYATVGEFNAPYRIILFLYVIPSIWVRAYLPRMTQIFRSGALDEFHHGLLSMLQVSLLVSLPAATVLICYASDIAHLLFGNKFAGSGLILAWMSLSLVLNYLRTILNLGLFASNQEWRALMMYLAGIGVNAAVAWLLVKEHGGVGVIIGSICAEVFLCAAYAWLLKTRKPEREHVALSSKLIFFSLAQGTLWWFLHDQPIWVRASASLVLVLAMAGWIYRTERTTLNELRLTLARI